MLIDSAKAVINIAGASVTTLRTKHLADLPALSRKAEDLARDMVKAKVASIPSAREMASTAGSGPATAGSQTDGIPKVSTPQLNPEHHLSSPLGSS